MRACPAVLASATTAVVESGQEPDDLPLSLARQMRNLKSMGIFEPASFPPLVPHLLYLSKLSRLVLGGEGYSEGIDLRPLSSLSRLRLLVLDSIQHPINLIFLTQIRSLELVESSGSPGLHKLTSLWELQTCRQADIASLSFLVQLSRLDIATESTEHRGEAARAAFRALQHLPSLRVLNSVNLRWCKAVQQLCRLTQLTALWLRACDEFDLDTGILDLTALPLLKGLGYTEYEGDIAITAPSVCCMYITRVWVYEGLAAPYLPVMDLCHSLEHLMLSIGSTPPGRTYYIEPSRLPPQLVRLSVPRTQSAQLIVEQGARVQLELLDTFPAFLE